MLGQTHVPSNLLSCFIQWPDTETRKKKRANISKSSLISALSIDLSDHNTEGNCIKIIKTQTKTWTIEHKLSQIIFTSVQLSALSSHLLS